MVDTEMIEEKLDEVLGLEMAAQKAVQKIDSGKVKSTAAETEQKASQMMKIYLGDDAYTSEALEFLCIAEGGEVTHYEVLDAR
jgi:hypothetical protein